MEGSEAEKFRKRKAQKAEWESQRRKRIKAEHDDILLKLEETQKKVIELEKKNKIYKEEVGELRQKLKRVKKEAFLLSEKALWCEEARYYHIKKGDQLKKEISKIQRRKEKHEEEEEEDEEEEVTVEAEEKVEESCSEEREEEEDMWKAGAVLFQQQDYQQVIFRQMAMDLLKYFKKRTETKQKAYQMVSKLLSLSTRTLLRWQSSYSKNGVITGKVHKGGKLWLLESEDLLLDARAWCKSQREGFTAADFLRNYLQKNQITSSLKSVKTSQRYLKRLGFKYGPGKRALYIDGHEREDVVAYRKVFCHKILVSAY